MRVDWIDLSEFKPTMKSTRSGDYQLPGPLRRSAGNLLLGLAPCFPRACRQVIIRRGPYYQPLDCADAEDSQGLTINKWNALRLPEDLSGRSVIDIGCADGFFCVMCARRGASPVLGVDTAPGRLLRARFMALESGLPIRYRMETFPSPRIRGPYDYVFCLSVLHHSLSQKNPWKVLADRTFEDELETLRGLLAELRTLTGPTGKCFVELPYEYSEPAERQTVDFSRFTSELVAAGFTRARCLGSWEYNERHRLTKDRILYLAEAGRR